MKVFVSYSSWSAPAAHRLVGALRGAGLDAWLDADGVRAPHFVADAIGRALDHAIALVAVLTPESLDSDWVQAEAYYARMRGAKIIAWRAARVGLPSWLAPDAVVDATTGEEAALQKLIDMLRALSTRRRIARSYAAGVRRR